MPTHNKFAKMSQPTGKPASNVPEMMKLVSPDEIGVNPTVTGSISTNRYIELICAEMERNVLRVLSRILNASDFVSCAAAILGTEIRMYGHE
jgi:hypothetical protein